MEKNLIKYEDLESKLLTLTNEDDKPVFALKEFKLNLYYLIAKIASSKTSQAQKKQYLAMTKAIFSFENDQELIELYNLEITRSRSFEANVLVLLMKKMGLSRNYFMEQELMKAESEKTAQFYNLDLQLDEEFFKKKPMTPAQQKNDPKNIKMENALDFLSKNIKRDASL